MSKPAHINKTAYAVLMELARRAKANGGHIYLDRFGYDYGRNYKASIMGVSVEILDSERVSVAHYKELNGDLCRDPEVVFLRDRETYQWLPCEMTQDFAVMSCLQYQQICWYESETRLVFRPRMLGDAVEFCNMWMRNIKEQQELAVPAYLDPADDPTVPENVRARIRCLREIESRGRTFSALSRFK